MGIIDWFRTSAPAAPNVPAAPSVQALGEFEEFTNYKDPRLAVFLRDGMDSAAGINVTVPMALKNPTVIRCLSLRAFAIGALPLHLRDKETKDKATEHPLFRILHRKPNPWQTAFEFRSLMEQRMLTDGGAFARIVRGGLGNVLMLIPLKKVKPRQRNDWQLEYEYQPPNGGKEVFGPEQILHVRYGLSEDGINGLSLVKQAADAIALAIQTDRASARLFRNGMMVGGAMAVKGRLSQEAFDRLKAQMRDREGANEAHRWVVAEEGMEVKPFSGTGKDSQQVETRKHQIEDIARPFGVPRPLLGVDDTSWGSGIDVLGQFFVRYGLTPSFVAWEQAIERDLLTEKEADQYEAKFNAGALLRGSMTEQAQFFATGLGAGGHQPFLHPDEVREWLDMPPREDLPKPPGQATKGTGDEPLQTAGN